METDSFFYQLLKQMPQTLFELLGLPVEQVRAYRFDSVEVKKSFRIDGLFRPTEPGLPLYFVEVQHQAVAKFYANLFAKVFCFLEENDPVQEWIAVAILASRSVEPKQLETYEDFLASRRPMPADPPVGLSIVRLLSASKGDARRQVIRLMDKVEHEKADSEFSSRVIELVEGLLLRRFPDLDREEVRTMFKLHDIRKSKVWQEAHDSGVEEGIEKGIEKGIVQGIAKAQDDSVRRCLATGMSPKEIAMLLGIALKDVRRIAKQKPS